MENSQRLEGGLFYRKKFYEEISTKYKETA